MASKLQYGELKRLAPNVGVDPDVGDSAEQDCRNGQDSENPADAHDGYEELRLAMADDIRECRNCGDEFVGELWGKCCSDGCQAERHHDMGWA